jgi:hypothetical protein
MKRLIFIVIFLAVCIQVTTGQKKYFTRGAKISFYSRAPMEDIGELVKRYGRQCAGAGKSFCRI